MILKRILLILLHVSLELSMICKLAECVAEVSLVTEEALY